MSVLVLGMHRSGTSVATRMTSLLGLPTCDTADLSCDRRGNEGGIWESASLVRFNDRLLAAASAAWWCPPESGHDWSEELEAHGEAAREAFRAVHAGPRWIWKDPRNCLTLPFWLQALAIRPPVILMLRDPLEICASLTARNQFSTRAGLALWERHLRTAIRHLAGLPVLVCRYPDLLADATAWCGRVSEFLTQAGYPLRPTKALLACGYVTQRLRHAPAMPAERVQGETSTEQQQLAAALDRLVGAHPRFTAPELGQETPATGTFFAQQRHLHQLGPPPHAPARGRPAIPLFAAARSRQDETRPEASVIVITRDEGTSLAATLGRLTSTTPDATEIIVVDDHSSDGSAENLTPHPRIRVVRPPQPLGIARARNLGAQLARGRQLVFSDAHVNPQPGWLGALAAALEDPRAGAVNPVITGFGDPGRGVNGLTFDGPQLDVRWLCDAGRAEPFPVPLLTGCFLALRRDVFVAVGGFDDGMTGYGAEDLELCLRLWRIGYRCLSVPGARVAHRFRPRAEQKIDRTGFLHNLLRMATIHLAPHRLENLLAALSGQPEFPLALARVLASDIGLRKAQTEALCWHGDEWFFQRFGPACSMGAPPDLSRSAREVA